MPRTFLVSELVTKIQRRGGYVGSHRLTVPVLQEFLESGLAELHDILISKFGDDYMTKRSTDVTVANTESYAIPDDLLKLLKIDVFANGRWCHVPRFQLSQRNNFQQGSSPTTFGASPYMHRIEGDLIYLQPTPTTVDTYRLIYVKAAPKLTSLSMTIDGYNGWEEFAVLLALQMAKESQDEPASWVKDRILRQMQRIEWAADGRNAEVMTIPDPEEEMVGAVEVLG